MIRRDIIQCFRGTESEPNLDQVAAVLGVTREALLIRLKNEPPIEDFAELSVEEVGRVIRQFAGLAVFTQEIETTVSRFIETRAKIREIERKARDKGKC